MNYQIDQVQPNVAEQLCREITIDLPEWFGLPECNEYYVNGVKEHINFAVKVNKRYVGLLSLEFPYPRNGTIFWMGIFRQYHGQGLGYALMREAIRYAVAQSALTITVETLSPDERDANYLNTYRFYERQGFQPLFNLKPAGYQWNMVYMSLILDNKIQENNRKPFHPFLLPASIKDYPTIQNMARFYVYDMSRYCGFISDDWACPKDGLYESFDFKIYFEDPTRKAFLVLVERELAGFVLLNKIGISATTQWNMGEFFILAKFQGKGVAAQIAEKLWKTHPGQWEVSVIPENVLALRFWCKTIANFTNNNYSKELKSVSYHPEHPSRYILTFNSSSTD
ncbi:GNAT family N-acetyltransferase [Legionella cherrii]|uniref:N-acetyltransferase GCN5 n=1 Tax=Legionella cherrii TaxID=28084 RepID=A0ABY6T422_9GAMM|nr:GNAT family N-acetyltransferase [Legionella cherrii]VEB34096.1 N-acetyltransferase GCN5 [Legionella cherrii]